MSKALSMFNNKLVDFVEDLKEVLGHLNEYELIKTSAKFMAKVDPEKNQDIFDKHIAVPYHGHILKKDSTFFLNHEDYSVNEDTDNQLVSLLKSIWNTLSDNDKESIWTHFHVLLVLNSRCGGQTLT